MGQTRRAKYGIMGKLPFIGKYIRLQVDRGYLVELRSIEARFNGVLDRFDTLVSDLYDCLKDLERPLGIEANKFHNYGLVIHTRSSRTVTEYLERVYGNEFVNLDAYFSLYASSREVSFLDWYSNEESVEKYVDQMIGLLGLVCVQYKCEGYETLIVPESNETLAKLMSSRWLKLLIMDLIHVLTTVLEERTGG